MINRKPYILKDVIQRFKDTRFLMLDVDMIVRKPLDSLYNKLNNSDAAFRIQDGVWEGQVYDQLKVASGVILLKPTALSIIEKWIEVMETKNEISGIKKGKWYWDQITLWKTVEETSDMKLAIIERTYSQTDFHDNDAVIWSANVSDKKEAFRLFKDELGNEYN